MKVDLEGNEVDEPATPTQQSMDIPMPDTDAASLNSLIRLMLQQQAEQQARYDGVVKQVMELQTQLLLQSANKPKELKPFKMPSVKPPEFKGETLTMKAEEARARINNYLFTAETICRQHGFLADGEEPIFLNQVTFAGFISGGLKDTALQVWQNTANKESMTWEQYKEWITTFAPTLSFDAAVTSLTKASQTNSAMNYTLHFNTLATTIQQTNPAPSNCACGRFCPPIAESVLSVIYRSGLKEHLSLHPELYNNNTDLKQLQTESVKLDQFYYEKKTKGKGNNGNNGPGKQGTQPARATHQNQQKSEGTTTNGNKGSSGGTTPMELDNIQPKQKLTNEQKAFFREKGWCTFCKSKEHSYSQCDHPDNHRNRRQLNNVATETKNDKNDVHTVGNSKSKN
ncbi:hypothetical protein HDV05_004466 [Chytridiales sp. JEL 0842]|nr:hypothetical protein HDV05_004466 [Chytridiales sp. JEL 0842]